MHIKEEEVKPSLFGGDMSVCIKEPKHSTKRLLKLLGELSKDAGYHIGTSITFVYTTLTEKELVRLVHSPYCRESYHIG